MTPYDIFLLIDQCLTQASLENDGECLSPAADGNKHRDPQSDNMQRETDLSGMVPSNSSPQGLGEPEKEEAERV